MSALLRTVKAHVDAAIADGRPLNVVQLAREIVDTRDTMVNEAQAYALGEVTGMLVNVIASRGAR
jgi:hypothetical protein